MKKFFYFAFTIVSLLLTACADSIPDMNMSPGSPDGEIQNIEIETTATPNASDTVGAGMDGTSSSGSPQTPSSPDGTSANNQDSPSNPAPDSPAPRCVPEMQLKDALISVFWSRRNGEASPVEVLTVKAAAADAAEKLANMEMKLQTYKELLRTGWGNMQLNVILCQDSNKDGRCGKDEKKVVLFAVRAPTFISSRYPLNLGSNELEGSDSSSEENSDNMDSSSEESDSCEAGPLNFNLSASAETERNLRIKINRKFNTPVVLKLSF